MRSELLEALEAQRAAALAPGPAAAAAAAEAANFSYEASS